MNTIRSNFFADLVLNSCALINSPAPKNRPCGAACSRVVDCAITVYALARRVLLGIYSFFKHLLFGAPEATPLPVSEAVGADKGAHVAQTLAESLKTVFSARVRYSDEEDSVVELGTYIFDHLLDQGKGGVEFDPASEIYTVRFPQARRIPVIFHEKIASKLDGRVVDPEIHLAKDVQFKLGTRKIHFLGNSLTAKAKVDTGIMGKVSIGATVYALADEDPEVSTRMLASIALNEGTHVLVRGIVNNVICPLLTTQLSRILVRREPGIRLLHQILYPK